MTHLSFPEDIQALVAGYVLGDLDADERKQLQQLLADHPEIAQEISTLKETLSLLPYGLPSQHPSPGVRSRLLVKAERSMGISSASASASEAAPTPASESVSHSTVNPKPRFQRERLPSLFKVQLTKMRVPKMRLTIAIAIILGGCSVVLAHRVSTLQMRLATMTQVMELASTGTANLNESSALTVYPADTLLTDQWLGLTQVIQDHLGSLERSQGPVDIAATDPAILREALRTQPVSSENRITQVPILLLSQATLLGGSPCQFSQTKGLRVTYTLPNQSIISLYQIDLKGEQFPAISDAYITVNQDNVNLVFWKQDNYLYALAAELPSSQLHRLTQVMALI